MKKDRIICWCSKITLSEIVGAVEAGATTVEEVRKITGKERTGFCEIENPKGICCENEFERIINETILQEKLKQLKRFSFG